MDKVQNLPDMKDLREMVENSIDYYKAHLTRAAALQVHLESVESVVELPDDVLGMLATHSKLFVDSRAAFLKLYNEVVPSSTDNSENSNED